MAKKEKKAAEPVQDEELDEASGGSGFFAYDAGFTGGVRVATAQSPDRTDRLSSDDR